MYLSRLYIENFRSIKKLDLTFTKGKTVIVGRNNAGKSNIIKAIDLVLGENVPTYQKSENLTDSDFYSWKVIVDGSEIVHLEDELFIWCELTRDENEPLDYNELYKCYGYYIYADIIDWDNRKPIKARNLIERNDLPERYQPVFGETEDSNDGKIYVNPKLRNQRTLEQELENKYCFALAFRGQRVDGKIIKELRLFYSEDDQSDWTMCFRASIRNELIQSAIIPSFRDPQSQLRLSSWTWYGKLMRYLTDGYDQDTELRGALATVNSVANRIFGEVSQTIHTSSLSVAFPGTEVSFQLNTESKTDLYKSCTIYVDDGFKSQLAEKGSGIQSALVIGLFNYYIRCVNTVSSALLCIEEPEIYLHPHARRVINSRLDDFIDNNRNQVILTTHSVEFVNTTRDDLNIIAVQKISQKTSAKPIRTKDYKHLLINNNQNEIFFADKVIVCEGFDDYIVRAIAEEFFPGVLDAQNVSVVAVGGKDHLAEMAHLVLRLDIKCFILADFDYLLRDNGSERRKYPTASAHKNIASLGIDFFAQQCIFGPEGGRYYRAVQKLISNLKRDYEKQFYTGKSVHDFNGFDFTKLLTKLRQNGICLLRGEIEHYSFNKTFLAPETKKLSLDKVYELNHRLRSGQKISEIFETDHILEFLNAVLSR